ncbi:uncharacterized protein TNCV_3252881 [Trichonephila clavipes]|nr:uncharacterized protein TNCV_3252881 [Trichonephila clavipes]
MEAKHANEFRPNDVMWEKTSKDLLRNPDRLLKNTDKRMVYIYGNIFFAKKDFTLGLRTVKSGEIHLIQTTHVPMLIYELPASSLKCRAQPNVIRRSFEPYDQMLYHRTIFEPHTAYPIPAETSYIALTVQKTAFGLDIIPEFFLSQLIQKGFPVGDFRKMKKIPHVIEPVQIPLVPQSPVQIPDVLELVQIPLVPQSPVQIPDVPEPVQIPVSQVPQPPVQIPHVPEPPVQIPVSQVPQSPVQIPHVPEPPVQILHVPEPMQILHVPEPMQILHVPEPMQILHVPEPMQIPPELDTSDPLEPTDAFDQLMSFVFGPQP